MVGARRLLCWAFFLELLVAGRGAWAGERPEELLRAKFDGLGGLKADATLKEALAYFSEHYHVPIEIDEAGFRYAGIPDVATLPVKSRPTGTIHAGFGLQLLLDTIEPDAKFMVRGNKVVIVPGKPSFPDAGKKSRLARVLTRKTTDFKDGLEESTLERALYQLSHQGKLFPVLVRGRPFGRDVLEDKVRLPKLAQIPLGEALQQLLNQIGATYTVCEDFVLIVPSPKKAQTN
jgi:hypothetical protein